MLRQRPVGSPPHASKGGLSSISNGGHALQSHCDEQEQVFDASRPQASSLVRPSEQVQGELGHASGVVPPVPPGSPASPASSDAFEHANAGAAVSASAMSPDARLALSAMTPLRYTTTAPSRNLSSSRRGSTSCRGAARVPYRLGENPYGLRGGGFSLAAARFVTALAGVRARSTLLACLGRHGWQGECSRFAPCSPRR
jgi:hypothetical protein